jgi:hypothetical protein
MGTGIGVDRMSEKEWDEGDQSLDIIHHQPTPSKVLLVSSGEAHEIVHIPFIEICLSPHTLVIPNTLSFHTPSQSLL